MLYVDGIGFASKAEYEDALEDKKIIDEIKAAYDLNNKSDVEKLYKNIRNFRFRTKVGDNFDDYIYGLYQKIRSGDFDKPETGTRSSVKVRNKKKETAAGKAKPGKVRLDPELKGEVLKEIKRRNRNRTILIITLLLIAGASIGYFVKYYSDAFMVDRNSDELAGLKNPEFASVISVNPVISRDYDEDVVIPDILDEYAALYNKNKSMVGWIKIDDTVIDYPVMQTADNEYYLKHNFELKNDNNGCIFLDANCDIILGNTNFILYGHHMKSGKMFGSLVKYANTDYYEKHKLIQFDTIYAKGTYEVMYAFRSRIYNSDEITFKYYQFIDANSAEEFDSYMEEMDRLSLIDTGVTASYGDSLLTLSTCDYQEENGRFVVVAKKIK